MFKSIRWRCHVRTNDRRGAESVVGRLAGRLDRTLHTETYERYWKYPELAELRLISPLESVSSDAALLSVLQSAWRIATPWALGAPGPDGEFDGVASVDIGSRFNVPGIQWMEFHVANRR
ncbi:hypothetical protein [Streptomyces sp. enrichment culture]|uniref:hypothetical protein n=1 Tax=Streptomyces sp. enrichment culture TaxID=1795815 RepID=UPI003F555319